MGSNRTWSLGPSESSPRSTKLQYLVNYALHEIRLVGIQKDSTVKLNLDLEWSKELCERIQTIITCDQHFGIKVQKNEQPC